MMTHSILKSDQAIGRRDGLIHSEVSISEIPMWQLPGKGKVSAEQPSKVVFRTLKGKQGQIKVPIEIIPSAKWGFPTVLDLEYFRAFERALTIVWEREGIVPDVLQISGRELIRLTGREPNGDRQREVREFLDRLSGLVLQEFRQDKKGRRSESGVHIFERIDRHELQDTEQWAHQIRLADWYWANLNNFHCHVQDQRLFWSLRRDLTKLLYQHLHSLFRIGRGAASESYSELTTHVSLKRLRAISEVRRQLQPAHDELETLGFLGKWWIERATNETKDYLIFWEAGPAWYEVYQIEQARVQAIEQGPVREVLTHESGEVPASYDEIEQADALKEIYDFVGRNDQAYEPFWKKVIESFTRTIRHRVIAEVRELAVSRRIRTTRARALVSAFQREGKRQGVPGWTGRSRQITS